MVKVQMSQTLWTIQMSDNFAVAYALEKTFISESEKNRARWVFALTHGFDVDPNQSFKEETVRKVLEFNFAGSVVQNTVALSVTRSMHKRLWASVP